MGPFSVAVEITGDPSKVADPLIDSNQPFVVPAAAASTESQRLVELNKAGSPQSIHGFLGRLHDCLQWCDKINLSAQLIDFSPNLDHIGCAARDGND